MTESNTERVYGGDVPGLSADDLRDELGQFHPPQGYVRLAHHPEMLAVCEKAAAEEPIRRMTGLCRCSPGRDNRRGRRPRDRTRTVAHSCRPLPMCHVSSIVSDRIH